MIARKTSSRTWLVALLSLLGCVRTVAPQAGSAPVYIDGSLQAYATQVSIQTGGQPQPTPTPPRPEPTPPQPSPPSPPVGECPPNYIVLNKPMSFCANCWGADGVPVPPGETRNFCAIYSASTARAVKFRTADRTGASQCSNVRMTIQAPDGREPLVSQAINNSLNVNGTEPPGYLAPRGVYTIQLYGDTPRGSCTTQQVMVYWQY